MAPGANNPASRASSASLSGKSMVTFGVQVVGRAEPPVSPRGQQRVVARMIIEVRDRRIEAHPPEQLSQILPGVCARAAELVGKSQV